MKRILSLGVLVLLISSCANRGFNKPKYGKLNWINHGFEKKEQAVQNSTEPKKTDTNTDKAELNNHPTTIETVTELPEQKKENFSSENEVPMTTAPVVKTKEQGKELTILPVVVQKEEASQEEKEVKVEEQKNQTSAEKKSKKKGGLSTDTLLLVIIAIFIPPLAVYLAEGAITTNFWINLILTLLFWLPGFIHALIVIL